MSKTINGHPTGTASFISQRKHTFAFWEENGRYHRVDGPAYIGEDIILWFVHGETFDPKPIIDQLGIDYDYRNWSDEDKVAFRLAL